MEEGDIPWQTCRNIHETLPTSQMVVKDLSHLVKAQLVREVRVLPPTFNYLCSLRMQSPLQPFLAPFFHLSPKEAGLSLCVRVLGLMSETVLVRVSEPGTTTRPGLNYPPQFSRGRDWKTVVTSAVVSPLNSILQPSDVTFSEHIHSKDLHNSVIHFTDVLLDLFSPLLGSDYDTYIRFLDVFSEFGHIPGHNCWSSNVPKIKNVCNSVEERATDT